MFTAQFCQKILPNFEKVLSKMKFGEIYYWENCMQLMQKYFWCHINFCVTKCYLFKRRLKFLTSRSPPYKDIKGWNQEMNLYLIAMWFCHSQVIFYEFCDYAKIRNRMGVCNIFGFIVISMSWISYMQVMKESNYEITNKRKKKILKLARW